MDELRVPFLSTLLVGFFLLTHALELCSADTSAPPAAPYAAGLARSRLFAAAGSSAILRSSSSVGRHGKWTSSEFTVSGLANQLSEQKAPGWPLQSKASSGRRHSLKLLPAAGDLGVFMQQDPPSSSHGLKKKEEENPPSEESSGSDAASTASGSTATAGAPSEADAPAFKWDLSGSGEGAEEGAPRPRSEPTTKNLLESLKLDLQEKLVLHHSSKSFYTEARKTGTYTDLPQAVTGKLCSKVLVRVVKRPSATTAFYSSVMARLGTAFNRLKAAGKIIMAKLAKLFRADGKGGKPSQAVAWIKKMASAAWAKLRVILNKILTVVVRFLPLILLITNLVLTGMSIASFIAAPNPLALIGLISTIFCLLSFIFSSSIQVHSQKIAARALNGDSEVGDLQLFGLNWASLRAEEEIQESLFHPSGFEDLGGADEPAAKKKESEQSDENEERKKEEASASSFESPAGATPDARHAAEDEASTEASSEDEKEKTPTAEGRKKSAAQGDVSAEELAQQTAEARKRMRERIKVDKVKKNFETAKKKFEEAKKTKTTRGKKIWKMAKTSIRLFAESLNYGLHKVLERFGRAWEWAVNVGLKKLIRYLRMLKLYTVIAAWFEKFATVLKWLSGQGKFYLKIFETLRGSASFIITNADKITSLIRGTIHVSCSFLDFTVFIAMFLNALTKPIYGLYFAFQGMAEDATRSCAMKEFELNRKAFTNFLLGSAAIEGDIGHAAAFDVPPNDLLEIMFLMTYLEQYKAHSMQNYELRGLNPLQAYTFYERTVRLDQLLNKMKPEEKAKFKNVFSSLKTWRIDETATAARDNLLSNVQHCILLASIGELTKRISAKAVRLFSSLGIRRSVAKRSARSFSRRITHFLTHSPTSITNPANLEFEVRQALRRTQGFVLRPVDVSRLQAIVYEIALDVISQETVLEVPGGGGNVVDPTAIHVNLLPFRTSLSIYDLYDSLQRLFTISMTATEQRETALKSSLGIADYSKPCPVIRPTIGLFPESDKAIVIFGEGLCAKISASNFLRTHIDPKVRKFIREEVFDVNADECAPFTTETFTAIDISIEQILQAGLSPAEQKEAIKHAGEEVVDRFPFAIEANRELANAKPAVKLNTFRALRLLQTMAMKAEEWSMFHSLVEAALARQFGVGVQFNSRISELVEQMYKEYNSTRKFCEACVLRHMLELILSVEIANSNENAQFLFRLFARVYSTSIMNHIQSTKSNAIQSSTYWEETKLFSDGLPTFDPLSVSIVKFFYYSDTAKLEETLSGLFEQALADVQEGIRLSPESPPSASAIVLRLHNYVKRKAAYAAEIAAAQGREAPPPMDDRHVYEELHAAVEEMAAGARELKPLLINVLKNGQYFPRSYYCMDYSSPAMWLFSTGISSSVTEMVKTLHRSRRKKVFHRPRKQEVESQVLLDVLSLLESIHTHGIEGTCYVLDMRYRFKPKKKEEGSTLAAPATKTGREPPK
ncbi:hypothetical protein Efla_005051 [Eimeria flavescens]